jgi:alkyldihydroxyacetonephosphate synthase
VAQHVEPQVGQGAEQSQQANRIYPDRPPAPRADDALSLDVWGYRDSGFETNAAGDVEFKGARYPISGTVLPDLLDFAAEVLGTTIDPQDVHVSSYPPKIPTRVVNPAFEAAVGGQLDTAQLVTDDAIRLRHGHGHTQEEMWAVKHGEVQRIPDLVVYPESDDDVQQLVDAALAHAVCLIPYGGCTNVTDALRCPADERRSIVSVDMSRMNRVRWIDPENRMACIEAGATGTEIAEQLERHGFTMGHEPDSYELSTMGGWVATNASGMKKNRYGNIDDLVLGIDVKTARGALHREMTPARESVGGDPARWLLGSEGKLGIITSCVVKIFPLPEAQVHGSVIFRDFETGYAFMRDVHRSGALPASIRLMDNIQFRFGQALKPRKEGVAAIKSMLEKVLVTKVLGYDPECMVACTLLFEGSKEEVEAQQKTVYRLAKKNGGMKGGAENGERGYQLTFSIAYIRDFMMRLHILAESFETAVSWSQAMDLCKNVKQRVWQEHEKRGLPGTPFISCRVTQLYDTGVCVYFYYGYYYKGVPNPSEVYSELETLAREEILRLGGSLSHHHGVGKLRQHFLPEIFSKTALDWRDELKRSVDPDDVFGCGN